MSFLKSVGYLLWGIIKRLYYVVPALLLDPLDLADRLFEIQYAPPKPLMWSLFGIGLFIAVALTYHELRKRIALQPKNWIEEYKAKHGELPLLPSYLRPVAEFPPVDKPISKDMEIKVASGQYWNSLSPSQQDRLLELVEWSGQDPRDYIAQMRKMLPKTPKGAGNIRWRNPRQH